MKNLVLVFALLLTLACCTTEADRNRMRAGLDSINIRNRNGQPFTVSDVHPYVAFFDEHGTPNDRLLAHYLLGLAYYDHGEAPMALQCYQDAAECADTTAADCDYAQLARVYGQMAIVFYYQGLYKNMLLYYEKSVNFAWIGKDTLLALRNYEQEFLAYRGLGINIDEPGNVVWRETKNHRTNSNKLTKDWTDFMKKNPTKEQVLKKRDELEKRFFGNMGDIPHN